MTLKKKTQKLAEKEGSNFVIQPCFRSEGKKITFYTDKKMHTEEKKKNAGILTMKGHMYIYKYHLDTNERKREKTYINVQFITHNTDEGLRRVRSEAEGAEGQDGDVM